MIVRIQSHWYDLTHFAHPGGDCWLGEFRNGEDATLAVAVHHPSIEVVLARLAPYKMEGEPVIDDHTNRTHTPSFSLASYELYKLQLDVHMQTTDPSHWRSDQFV